MKGLLIGALVALVLNGPVAAQDRRPPPHRSAVSRGVHKVGRGIKRGAKKTGRAVKHVFHRNHGKKK